MNLVERNKLLDKVSVIVIMGIFVEFFLFAVDTCFTTRIDLMTTTPVVLNVLGLVFLAVSAFIFIRMYQKNDNKNLIYGIEFLVLAFLCPFMTYWYYPKYFGLSTNFIHKINHHALWIVVIIYYVIRVCYEIYKAYQKNKPKQQSFKKKKVKN